MRLSVRNVGTRSVGLCLASWLAACDNWPVQHDVDGSGGAPDPEPSDAGTDCVTVSTAAPSTSAQVNGGLCFGLAHGNSLALQCAARATPNVVDCVDGLLGDAFEVRWTGDRASVRTGLGSVEIGSITLVGADTFEVATSTQVEATCTLQVGPPPRVEFCLSPKS